MTSSNDLDALERKTLDHHIRSATTLVGILCHSGVIAPEYNDPVNEETSLVLASLMNLTYCLVCAPDEIVAAGLLASSRRVVVSSSPHDTSQSPKSESEETMKASNFDQELYATNSGTALDSSTGIGVNNGLERAKNVGLRTITTKAWAYMDDYLKARDRVVSPTFPTYAATVFQLYKVYLETPEDSQEELAALRLFATYVFGLSLPMLSDRLENANWKGRSTKLKTFQDFVKSDCEYFNIEENTHFSDNVNKEQFISLLDHVKLEISDDIRRALDTRTFTNGLAGLCHKLLKSLYTSIMPELERLGSGKRSYSRKRTLAEEQNLNNVIAELHENLVDCYNNMVQFQIYLQDAQELLHLNVSAIDPSCISTSSTPDQDPRLETREEDTEVRDWPHAYLDWKLSARKEQRQC